MRKVLGIAAVFALMCSALVAQGTTAPTQQTQEQKDAKVIAEYKASTSIVADHLSKMRALTDEEKKKSSDKTVQTKLDAYLTALTTFETKFKELGTAITAYETAKDADKAKARDAFSTAYAAAREAQNKVRVALDEARDAIYAVKQKTSPPSAPAPKS
ncbi:MAG: hypothetical protein Q7S28_01895 [bacterium]|nr:hypothetical protein [bacterium]